MRSEERAGKALRQRCLTIALAESCTGGLLASLLTDVPGASDYFLASYVTYSNESKVSALGVSPSSIEAYGAVSDQVAREMAFGARKAAGADIGIGITGIAGPGGGSEPKPVGLAYIALDMEDRATAVREIFPGIRRDVKLGAAERALDMLIATLEG